MRFIVPVVITFFLSFPATARDVSPEQKFVQDLYGGQMSCGLQLSMAQTSGRFSDAYEQESFGSAASCIKREKEKAEKGFKVVYKNSSSKEIKDGLKNVYAKWLALMDGMYVRERVDPSAQSEFEAAANSLRIDLMVR